MLNYLERSTNPIAVFFLGLIECRSDCGMTYDDDSWSRLSVAYDRGRNLGCKILRLD